MNEYQPISEEAIETFAGVAARLAQEIQEAIPRLPICLVGSMAVATRCSRSMALWPRLGRTMLKDIDFVTLPKFRDTVFSAMCQVGCVPTRETRVDLAQHRRFLLKYHDLISGEFVIEVFLNPLKYGVEIDVFELCHGVSNVRELPVSALFCSKLLYSERSESQLADLVVLLAEFEIVARGSSNVAAICLGYLERISRSWAKYQTMMENLTYLEGYARESLGGFDNLRSRVEGAVREIRVAITGGRKPFHWHLCRLMSGLLGVDFRDQVERRDEIPIWDRVKFRK